MTIITNKRHSGEAWLLSMVPEGLGWLDEGPGGGGCQQEGCQGGSPVLTGLPASRGWGESASPSQPTKNISA